VTNAAFRQQSDELGGIKGLATGPDRALYASFHKAILRIALEGDVTTILNPVVVENCEPSTEATWAVEGPGLQGLAVDAHGNMFVAASRAGGL
jgi:hypothetical protein